MDDFSRAIWIYLIFDKREVSRTLLNFFALIERQNGRVERNHRHILNVARALRFQDNLPISFWGEYVLTAGYLINRTPTPVLFGKTPYEMLHGQASMYDHFKIFGCLCYTLG
uniref:Retrovirus-related Pol polyprotein from transposon TNT 1-94 n=1 Tax=Cajanus cajan TaxID=3821 RepID=A0A151RT72_CAJCA|nr:Retrovirus-related Pol polyprotein from transposon TNT 1-94 [Cajanus cajan]